MGGEGGEGGGGGKKEIDPEDRWDLATVYNKYVCNIWAGRWHFRPLPAKKRCYQLHCFLSLQVPKWKEFTFGRKSSYMKFQRSFALLSCTVTKYCQQLHGKHVRIIQPNATTDTIKYTCIMLPFLIDYTLHNVPMGFWNQVTLVLYLGCLQWTEIWKL